MHLDDGSAVGARPFRSLPFVVAHHADVVDGLKATGAQEVWSAGIDGPVQPQPLHHERRCHLHGRHSVPPIGVSQTRRCADDLLESADVGGQHHAVCVDEVSVVGVDP